MIKLLVAFTVFGYALASVAGDGPMPDFFCGSDLVSNSGFVEAGNKSCADGTIAAKADSAGTVLCTFNARCVPATPQIKQQIESFSGRPYDSLSDEVRYKTILGSGMLAGTILPMAQIMCRTKTDPCHPSCPSMHDCADPKKGGSNQILRLLPVDGSSEPQAFQRDGNGDVRKNNGSRTAQ